MEKDKLVDEVFEVVDVEEKIDFVEISPNDSCNQGCV